MPENPDENGFTTTIFFLGSTVNARLIEQHFHNNTIEDVYRNQYYIIWYASMPHVKVFANNNIFRNSSSLNLMFVVNFVQCTMDNNTFEDLSDHSNYIIGTFDLMFLKATATTLRNINGHTYSRPGHWLVSGLTSSISIEGVNIVDSKMGESMMFNFYNAYPGSFYLSNVVFDNIETVGGFPLIGGNIILGADLQNITFKNIYKFSNFDNTNVMMKFTSLSLTASATYIFNLMTVTNSTVPLFVLDSLDSPTTENASLIISNLDYHDCTFNFSESLIHFNNIFSSSNFKIIIDTSNFYNIHYVREGRLWSSNNS